MRDETSEASAKAGPGVLLADEPGSYSGKALRNQAIKGAPLYLLVRRCTCSAKPSEREKCRCLPAVALVNRGSSTLVRVSNAPWGWGVLDRVYLHKPLHPKSLAAERYGGEIRQRLADAAWTEYARREDQKDLRLREARVRIEGQR